MHVEAKGMRLDLKEILPWVLTIVFAGGIVYSNVNGAMEKAKEVEEKQSKFDERLGKVEVFMGRQDEINKKLNQYLDIQLDRPRGKERGR